MEVFKELFATDKWPARWHCGEWTSLHGWIYIISDVLIGFAYIAIPLIILRYFLIKKSNLRFAPTYLLFAAFIMLCGTTHFIDAIMFWVPVYRFNAFVLAITAVVSIATVFHLIQILPMAFKLKTSTELEEEIKRRELAELQLEEANKNLTIFSYAASHDLKEPLRKIGMFSSQLSISGDNEDTNRRNRELVQKIALSSSRMQNLIDELLALASINENIVLQPVDLSPLLKEVIDELELRISEKKATINMNGSFPAVHGESTYLRQLFINLVGNALKFNNSIPVVSITSSSKNNLVEIMIADNGIGMNPEQAKTIFEPFQRLHAKSKFEGAGIGLAIVSRIIAVHKGTIRVETAEGVGSTFIISLPKAE